MNYPSAKYEQFFFHRVNTVMVMSAPKMVYMNL